MIKELCDKEKLLSLEKLLDEFLSTDDCIESNCEKCLHQRLCNNIYRLDTTLRMRYLKS